MSSGGLKQCHPKESPMLAASSVEFRSNGSEKQRQEYRVPEAGRDECSRRSNFSLLLPPLWLLASVVEPTSLAHPLNIGVRQWWEHSTNNRCKSFDTGPSPLWLLPETCPDKPLSVADSLLCHSQNPFTVSLPLLFQLTCWDKINLFQDLSFPGDVRVSALLATGCQLLLSNLSVVDWGWGRNISLQWWWK